MSALAEKYIYRMPTVEEVTKAGYPASYHATVKVERDALIARFDSDPDFRAKVMAEHKSLEPKPTRVIDEEQRRAASLRRAAELSDAIKRGKR